jgi:hypothetical protein
MGCDEIASAGSRDPPFERPAQLGSEPFLRCRAAPLDLKDRSPYSGPSISLSRARCPRCAHAERIKADRGTGWRPRSRSLHVGKGDEGSGRGGLRRREEHQDLQVLCDVEESMDLVSGHERHAAGLYRRVLVTNA